MRSLSLILLLFISLDLASQKVLSHAEIVNLAKEVKIIDRLYLDITNLEKIELDPATAFPYFKKMYGNPNELLSNTRYYICGKITSHPDFDLLILYAEEKAIDSNRNFDLLLSTTRKDGTQISLLSAAADLYYMRNDKLQFRKTRSYLYNGFKIKQANEISAMNKKYEAEYKINDYGVIVSYPKMDKS